jgi:hypothetical protein
MMRELKRREYNEPSRSSVTSPFALPCGLQDVYIWWTKLTAVKYGNKSVKHITRTVSPTGAPTRLTLSQKKRKIIISEPERYIDWPKARSNTKLLGYLPAMAQMMHGTHIYAKFIYVKFMQAYKIHGSYGWASSLPS